MQRRVQELFWGLSLGKIETASVIPEDGVTGAEYRFRQEEEDL